MLRSFRLRLALWSAMLAGIALAGFAAFAWLAVRDARLKQVEAQVGMYAERETRRVQAPEDWQRFEQVLALTLLHAREPGQVLFLVEDADGGVIHRSAHWPAEANPAQFPWPKAARLPQEPPPENAELPPQEAQPGREGQDNAQPQDTRMEDDRFRLRPPREGGVFRPPLPVTAVPLTLHAGGKNWKFALASGPRTRVALAMSTEMVDAEMAGLRNAFMLALPLALVIIALGAWVVSGRALSPVRRLNASIRSVTARGLDQRIATGGEDREFTELIEEFNGMLERLEKSFHQASRFSGDAAHELRTPLTVLQGEIERAMDKAPPGSDMQAALSRILDETGRLATILRKLLLLSRADAGRLRLQPVQIDLTAKLAALAEDAHMMAPELKIDATLAPGLTVNADEALLHQLLTNLISNAIKYNIGAGWIRLSARQLQGYAVVTVSNSSHGIAAEAREKLFDRFFRADSSHSRNIDGSGLGLSLSREIARAHGGDLTLSVGPKKDVSLKLVIPGRVAQQL
jgi:two-component system heavy metal sensor histidine kinase CusS